MDKLESLKKANPKLKIYTEDSPEVSLYGRRLFADGIARMCDASYTLEMPTSGSAYYHSVKAMEKTALGKYISDELFGEIPTQTGLCLGYNSRMNAMEYHGSSEINLAVTDLLLLLAHVGDIREGGLDSSAVRGFFIRQGELVGIYPTTLHYCPCQTSDEGFRAVVALPRGTNTPLKKQHGDSLLKAVNKWIICHGESAELIRDGVTIGITGENYTVQY